MKQDYLWDKNGQDEEIQHLEAVLSVFRHDGTSRPPVLSDAKENARRSWFLSFGLTFASAAVIVVAVVSMFVFMSKGARTETARAPKAVAPISSGSEDHARNASPSVVPAEKRSVTPEPAIASALKIKAASARQRNLVAARAVRQKQPKLTREERFAYDQLMLALSISGSRLKIVKDAVEGTEESSNRKTR